MKKRLTFIILLLLISGNVYAASTAALSAYSKQKLIFLDTTASGANVSTDQANFPVGVHINTSSWATAADRDNLFDNTNSTGKRINFYVPGATAAEQGLPYEVDLFDNTEDTENGIWWVKANVEGSSSTDSGTADADSTTSVIEDDDQGWTTNQWQNWCVKMTSGATSGEVSLILSNDADTLVIGKPALSVEPDEDGFIIGSCLIIGYGTDVGSDQDNPTAVWDANFKGVWHMNDATTSSIADSTSNDSDETKKGANEPAVTTSGYVGSAQNSDGSDDYISISANASLKNASAGTISVWFNPDDQSPSVADILYHESTNNDDYTRFALRHGTDGKVISYMRDSDTGSSFSVADPNTVTAGTWYNFAVTVQAASNNYILYRNGASVATDTTAKGSFTNTTPVNIAMTAFSTGAWSNFYDGKLDEVRVSNTDRVADWLKLEYYSVLKTNYHGDSWLTPKGEYTTSAISAAVTGTITSSANEAHIINGGKTIIITLTNDTWAAAGDTFNAVRQSIINGLDSTQSEATGWDAEVKGTIPVTDVVRTSDTVVTITLSASADYRITANETITVTVPAAAVRWGVAITASPTITITDSNIMTSVFEQFLDEVDIDSYAGVAFGVNRPTKYSNNPVFGTAENDDWDIDKQFPNVIYEDSWPVDTRCRMWYLCRESAGTCLSSCYATSPNCNGWVKPILGLITYDGNTNNNKISDCGEEVADAVYWAADTGYVTMQDLRNSGATTGIRINTATYPYGPFSLAKDLTSLVSVPSGYFSPEGISIERRSDGRWLAYYQQQHTVSGAYWRDTGVILSDTTSLTGTWTNQGLIWLATSVADQKHSITSITKGKLHIQFLQQYDNTTPLGYMTTTLWVSRDGIDSTQLTPNNDPWIDYSASGWDSAWSSFGKTLTQIGKEWRYYYQGIPPTAIDTYPRNFQIGYSTIPLYRIGQVSGTGTIITALTDSTESLYINGNGNGGSIKVELLDSSDTPITGYEDTDSNILTGDSYNFKVSWGANTTMPAGVKKVKIYLTDATLYSVTESPVYTQDIFYRHGFINYNHAIN